jgi:KaiC/GvpD/RAD55 family RecA-like ATPase
MEQTPEGDRDKRWKERREAIPRLVESAGKFTPIAADPDRFKAISALELINRPMPLWQIKGLFHQQSIVMLVAPSGDGKSMVALDIAVVVAEGGFWRGRKVTKGKVVYVVAEGAGTFSKRLAAIQQHRGDELPENLAIIPAAPNLSSADDVETLIEAIGDVDLIIFDTLAQCAYGIDENSSQMGQIINSVQRIQQATGATVLLVHHMGKDASKGARGWSGIYAAMDTVISITRKDDLRVARVIKQKDGEEGVQMPFKLLPVDIGIDEDGDPITSCVVEHLSAGVIDNAAIQFRGDRQRMIWHELIRVHDDEGLGLGSVDKEFFLEQAIKILPEPEAGKRDRRAEIIKRGVADFIQMKLIRDNGFEFEFIN